MPVYTVKVGAGGAAKLPVTRWTLVRAACEPTRPGRQKALSELCITYWDPVHAFVHRRGHSAEEARDLTQEFFARVLEKNSLATADPSLGKFRNWLFGAVDHYLTVHWRWKRAQKRGGGQPLVSLDSEDAEGRRAPEPGHDMTPEQIFERRYALKVLEQALHKLQKSYVERGQGPLFEKIKPCLGGGSATPHGVIAAELGMLEKTFNVAVSRCKNRFRELLKAEIAETVGGGDAEIEEEMQHLLGVLRPPQSGRRAVRPGNEAR